MGKLHNLSFCHVANCENCQKARTKCWFFCIHVSCLEAFVFCSVASMGKLENLSFWNVSKRVVMFFCVADVALFDIQTCLMMFTKLQTWRKSRTKCCFFAPTCVVCVSRFPAASSCLWGKPQNPFFLECFQTGCHVVLHGRRGIL